MTEVKWRDNRSPAQRIHQRLAQGSDNYPLKPSAQTTTNPTRCVTTVYFGASQAPSDGGHGSNHDPVAAVIAAVGGVRPR
jgi:hypothetical protein